MHLSPDNVVSQIKCLGKSPALKTKTEGNSCNEVQDVLGNHCAKQPKPENKSSLQEVLSLAYILVCLRSYNQLTLAFYLRLCDALSKN